MAYKLKRKETAEEEKIQLHIIILFFSFVWLPTDDCAFVSAQDTLDIYSYFISCMLACTFQYGDYASR
jgi:hypothetical protein